MLRVAFVANIFTAASLFSAVSHAFEGLLRPILVKSRQPSLRKIPLASALGPNQHENLPKEVFKAQLV